jgi:hypothetical protein
MHLQQAGRSEKEHVELKKKQEGGEQQKDGELR